MAETVREDAPGDASAQLRCEEVAGEEARKVIMEGFQYQAEKTEPCLSSDCCSAGPAACGAFPPEHATATGMHY